MFRNNILIKLFGTRIADHDQYWLIYILRLLWYLSEQPEYGTCLFLIKDIMSDSFQKLESASYRELLVQFSEE